MGEIMIVTYSIASRPSFDEVSVFVAQIMRVKDRDTFPMILVGYFLLLLFFG
jgi:GTPase KRas protein